MLVVGTREYIFQEGALRLWCAVALICSAKCVILHYVMVIESIGRRSRCEQTLNGAHILNGFSWCLLVVYIGWPCAGWLWFVCVYNIHTFVIINFKYLYIKIHFYKYCTFFCWALYIYSTHTAMNIYSILKFRENALDMRLPILTQLMGDAYINRVVRRNLSTIVHCT